MEVLWNIVRICLGWINLFYEFVLSFIRREEVISFDDGYKVVICKKIADGGFSTVYEARDYNPSKRSEVMGRYALKKIICGDEEIILKCREEASVHRVLHHPNLMKLLSMKFEDKGPHTICYMLFPLYNKSLRDEINQRGILQKSATSNDIRVFQPREIVEILSCVVDGVQAMHHHGFTHRDIKLENILLNSNGEPILMDFGSVGPAVIMLRSRADCLKLVDNASTNTTMPYRAPELFDGGARYGEDEPDIDGRIDVWSLGCVLFAMMYGASPFECEFRGEKTLVVDCSHLRVLGNIPAPGHHTVLANRYGTDLIQLVKWMLTKDRTLRPTIEEVTERFDDLLQQLGSTRTLQQRKSHQKGDNFV